MKAKKDKSVLAKVGAAVRSRHPGIATKKARTKAHKIIRKRGGGKGDTR